MSNQIPSNTTDDQTSPLLQSVKNASTYPVDETLYQAQLQKAIAQVSDPDQGFFGPNTVLWKLMRFNYPWLISASRMLILQSMHHWMAQAGSDASYAFKHPMRRAVNTFLAMSKIIFGNLQTAQESAEQIRRVHNHINGQLTQTEHPFSDTHYQANDAYALYWVHATLWETTVVAYELLYPPLTAEEKAQLHQELCTLALLFGVPEEIMAKDWDEFIAYNHAMWESDLLGSEGASREFPEYFLNELHNTMPKMYEPFFYLLREFNISILPQPIQSKLQLSYNETAAELFLDTVKVAAKLLLIPIPYNGIYIQRKAFLARRKTTQNWGDRFWRMLDTLPFIFLRLTTLVFLARKKTDDGMEEAGFKQIFKEIVAYRRGVKAKASQRTN